MNTTYNWWSLGKRNITQEDADDVLRTGKWFPLPPSERGNNRIMFVGFTKDGDLLEIGVEYFFSEKREHIFHGRKATRLYRRLFEEQR